MRRPHVLAALVVMATPLTLAAQIPADLAQAIKARDQTIDKVDLATWERLTASDFTLVDEKGRRLTRAERVSEFKKATPATTASICGQQRTTMFAGGTTATRTCL